MPIIFFLLEHFRVEVSSLLVLERKKEESLAPSKGPFFFFQEILAAQKQVGAVVANPKPKTLNWLGIAKRLLLLRCQAAIQARLEL